MQGRNLDVRANVNWNLDGTANSGLPYWNTRSDNRSFGNPSQQRSQESNLGTVPQLNQTGRYGFETPLNANDGNVVRQGKVLFFDR